MPQRTPIISLAVVAAGFGAICYQSFLIREFAAVTGGNEAGIGIFLACWLGWVSAGALAASPARTENHAAAVGAGALLAMPVGLFAGVCWLRASRTVLGIPPTAYAGPADMALMALPGAMPVAALTGAFFPAACRLAEGAWKEGSIGLVYAAEGAGGMMGGALFSFVLAGRLSPLLLASAALPPSAAVATALAYAYGGRVLRRILLAGAILGTIPAATGLYATAEEYTSRLRWKALYPTLPHLASIESRYQHIDVARLEDQYTITGNGAIITSFPDDYVHARTAHLVLAEHPSPSRVLVIGSGLEGIVGQMLLHPLKRLDYVEVDPALIDIISRLLEKENRMPRDDRLFVHAEDGLTFVLRSRPSTYDIVFVNTPDPFNVMANRYYTKEFYARLERILRPGGTVAVRIGMPSHAHTSYEGGNMAGSVFRTLRAVFTHVAVCPGETVYMFASNGYGVVSEDPRILAARYAARKVESRFFFHPLYRDMFMPAWIDSTRRQLSSSGRVNTRFRPTGYLYGLMVWSRYSGSRLGTLLAFLEASRLRSLLPAALLVVAATAAYVIATRRRGELLAVPAVVGTGMLAMTGTLVVVVGFQSTLGFVYTEIGILSGILMGGFAAGGFVGVRLLRRFDSSKVLISTDILLGMLMLSMPIALQAAGSLPPAAARLVFYPVAAAVGILCGAQFPLAGRLLSNRLSAVKAAAWMEWADHAGGMIGSCAAGLLFVPLMGIAATCVIMGAMKLIPSAAAMAAGRRR